MHGPRLTSRTSVILIRNPLSPTLEQEFKDGRDAPSSRGAAIHACNDQHRVRIGSEDFACFKTLQEVCLFYLLSRIYESPRSSDFDKSPNRASLQHDGLFWSRASTIQQVDKATLVLDH